MGYKLQDLIDVEYFQSLQDRLNEIYSFPSAIIDNEGNILTATAWQSICTKFHRVNPDTANECKISDKYIYDHIHEANPGVSYRCPRGLVDNATPIIIDGVHYGNFFTGQFFTEQPDLEFYREQAKKYGFDEPAYLEAVKKVPVWTLDQLNNYLYFIKGLIEVICVTGLKNKRDIETKRKIKESEEQFKSIFEQAPTGMLLLGLDGKFIKVNSSFCEIVGYTEDELQQKSFLEITHPEDRTKSAEWVKSLIAGEQKSMDCEKRYIHKSGEIIWGSVRTLLKRDENGNPLYFITHVQNITERKKSEEEIQTSEKKFRAIFENSVVPKSLTKFDGSLQVNNALCQMLGYSKEELSHLTWQEITHPEDIQKTQDEINQLLTGEKPSARFEKRFIHKNGTIVWAELSSSVHRDSKGTPLYLMTVLIDLTERKNAEKALELAHKELKNLHNNLNDAIFSIDILENKMLVASTAHQTVFGYAPEEFFKNPHLWYDLVIPEDKPKADGGNQLLASGKDIEHEVRITLPNGEIRWINMKMVPTLDAAGRLIRVDGIASDINEKKLAEAALQESEKRWRFIVESEPECVKVVDREGRLLEMNPAGLAMIQAESSEVIGKKTVGLVAEEDRAAFNEMIEGVFRGETRHLIFDMIGLKGRRLTLETTSGPLKDPASMGNVKALLGVTRDITDRKRAEEDIKKKNLELTELNASKDKFFSIIAHDLRSPFQGFISMTELMAEDVSQFSISDLSSFSKKMSKTAKNLYHLLENLLSWAQIQKGTMQYKPTEQNLRNLVALDIETINERARQKEIEVVNNVEKNLEILADEKMINTIVRNLLSNAVKFTDTSGRVIVKARDLKNHMIEISVHDTGIGIAPEDIKKLFKIDEKVRQAGTDGEPSTGLGLLLSKEFVEKHGGNIWVESTPGFGSTFYFTVPMKA